MALWNLKRAPFGSDEADRLITEGWEPFATTPVDSPPPAVLEGQKLGDVLQQRSGTQELVVLFRRVASSEHEHQTILGGW